ncbi:hypothetical protein J4231_01810 [Candidatus Woesearchaeota archaeon]|nr:hypothetical protein [Candidatus Woesearchaeota archaeon]
MDKWVFRFVGFILFFLGIILLSSDFEITRAIDSIVVRKHLAYVLL